MPPYTSPTAYLNIDSANPLTERELNTVGGQSTDQGGFRTGYNPTINNQTSPAPTPTQTTGVPDVPPAPTPTRAETLNNIKSEALRIQDILNEQTAGTEEAGGDFYTSDFQDGPAYEPFDEDAARRAAIRNQTRLYQAEIDATNQVYDQLLNEARIEGRGRIGSQRAIAARGGLLGSDFAGAQKQRVQDFNTDINRGIQAERVAAIGAIEGRIRESVQQELQGKREARQLGPTSWT